MGFIQTLQDVLLSALPVILVAGFFFASVGPGMLRSFAIGINQTNVTPEQPRTFIEADTGRKYITGGGGLRLAQTSFDDIYYRNLVTTLPFLRVVTDTQVIWDHLRFGDIPDVVTVQANGTNVTTKNLLNFGGDIHVSNNSTTGAVDIKLSIPPDTPYLLTSGIRPLTGNWNVGGFAVTGLGNLTPASDGLYDLGDNATPLKWRTGYFTNGIVVGNSTTFKDGYLVTDTRNLSVADIAVSVNNNSTVDGYRSGAFVGTQRRFNFDSNFTLANNTTSPGFIDVALNLLSFPYGALTGRPDLSIYEQKANKNATNGYAGLDSLGRVTANLLGVGYDYGNLSNTPNLGLYQLISNLNVTYPALSSGRIAWWQVDPGYAYANLTGTPAIPAAGSTNGSLLNGSYAGTAATFMRSDAAFKRDIRLQANGTDFVVPNALNFDTKDFVLTSNATDGANDRVTFTLGPFAKNWTNGTSVDSTNAAGFVNYRNPRMVANLTLSGKRAVMVHFTMFVTAWANGTAGVITQLKVDNAAMANTQRGAGLGVGTLLATGNTSQTIALDYLLNPLPAGLHSFEMEWTTLGTGTVTAVSTQRQLSVMEIP